MACGELARSGTACRAPTEETASAKGTMLMSCAEDWPFSRRSGFVGAAGMPVLLNYDRRRTQIRSVAGLPGGCVGGGGR